MSVAETRARRSFDSRLADLGLENLGAHDRDRLWQTHLKQRKLSSHLDDTVGPASEPSVEFHTTKDTR